MKRKTISEARKATKKRNKIVLSILAFVLAAVILFVAVVGVTLLCLKKQGRTNLTPDYDASDYMEEIEYGGHTYAYNKDVIAFAFVGVDKYEMENIKETEFVGANDADIVVVINTVSGKVNMIAIPRETVVDIDIYQNGEFIGQDKKQICLSYSYGDGSTLSCENATTSISRLLKNVPIEKYYALDMSGISAINDSIGGVIVKSQIDMPKYDVTAGQVVTLKGDMAEAYVRSRSSTDIDSSYQRTQRHVQYLQYFSNQTFSSVALDFGTVADLYNVGAQYSQTNMTVGDVTYMASLLMSKGTNSFSATTLKGEMKKEADSAGEGIYHALFYPDEEDLMQTVLDNFYLRVK